MTGARILWLRVGYAFLRGGLQNHFNNHWYQDMRVALAQFGIKGADVLKYRIELAEPVYDETGTARADFFTEVTDG